jgi:hypothetical protein
MKLNFWQILGLILPIVAVILVVRNQMGHNDVVQPKPRPTPSATAPA